jgi:signal transduction histidine kinase
MGTTLDGISDGEAMFRLVQAVQDLSLARSLDDVMRVVRTAAREITGADGATFVLRDGEKCYYAEEDAIAPLWKGKRFPLSACISGWAMIHREAVAIEDIYADPRIPADAYRPTFVKSLAMVPIRRAAPIGAIGNYWASRRAPSGGEVRLLQALADSTSIAMENVQLYADLEKRVEERTAELADLNRELEAFSYSVSHDLRAPLRSIDNFAQVLEEDHGEALGAEGRRCVGVVRKSAASMRKLIDDLLEFSRSGKKSIEPSLVDMGSLAREVLAELTRLESHGPVESRIGELPPAVGDQALLRQVLANLLSNALKYTRGRNPAVVEVGGRRDGLETVYFVRDNGAGFDMEHAGRLFGVFQRLHRVDEFEGTGVGLALVKRIVERHRGRVWGEGRPGEGATFSFALPTPGESHGTP